MNVEPEKQLIYAISHDFGSPIRRIVSFAQLLQGSCQDRLTEKEERWFEFLLSEGKLCQEMIQGLLTYSRIINAEFKPELVNLESICQLVIQQFQTTINEHQAQISFDNLPSIMGSGDQWYVFFEALLSNSLKYQPKEQAPIITISCQPKSSESLELTIEDNGIGVTEEQRGSLTAVLKRFQAEKDYPGLGMGLAYCMGVTQCHGATLSFGDSTLGGLAVQCVLPASCIVNDAP